MNGRKSERDALCRSPVHHELAHPMMDGVPQVQQRPAAAGAGAPGAGEGQGAMGTAAGSAYSAVGMAEATEERITPSGDHLFLNPVDNPTSNRRLVG